MRETVSETSQLAERMSGARRWGWTVFDDRAPGAARDLAWALISLMRDHDPQTYGPCSQIEAIESEKMISALTLAADIARLIHKADDLQPHLIRKA